MFNLIQSRGNSLRRKVCSSVGSHCALRFWGQFQPLLSVPIVGPFFSKGFFLKVWSTHNWSKFSSSFSLLFFAGSQCEELRLWQRSGGRRLSIHKSGIEPQESSWKFSSIYPQNQSLPTLRLCALTYTSDFTGGCAPPPLSGKELTYSSS